MAGFLLDDTDVLDLPFEEWEKEKAKEKAKNQEASNEPK